MSDFQPQGQIVPNVLLHYAYFTHFYQKVLQKIFKHCAKFKKNVGHTGLG